MSRRPRMNFRVVLSSVTYVALGAALARCSPLSPSTSKWLTVDGRPAAVSGDGSVGLRVAPSGAASPSGVPAPSGASLGDGRVCTGILPRAAYEKALAGLRDDYRHTLSATENVQALETLRDQRKVDLELNLGALKPGSVVAYVELARQCSDLPANRTADACMGQLRNLELTLERHEKSWQLRVRGVRRRLWESVKSKIQGVTLSISARPGRLRPLEFPATAPGCAADPLPVVATAVTGAPGVSGVSGATGVSGAR